VSELENIFVDIESNDEWTIEERDSIEVEQTQGEGDGEYVENANKR